MSTGELVTRDRWKRSASYGCRVNCGLEDDVVFIHYRSSHFVGYVMKKVFKIVFIIIYVLVNGTRLKLKILKKKIFGNVVQCLSVTIPFVSFESGCRIFLVILQKSLTSFLEKRL